MSLDDATRFAYVIICKQQWEGKMFDFIKRRWIDLQVEAEKKARGVNRL